MGRIRKAFVMTLNAGQEAEYKRRHDALWPEMAAMLRKHGVHNYSIFLHGNALFAYAEIDSEDQWKAIPAEPITQRWWKYMGDIMAHNPDNSPVAVDIKEVFHIE
ncbi:MAG TPA: L-rhamnose mutarotase [Planctomycetota bacterium]|nr:L-rhamnose mutarotase [Planctomycetota bacterium]